MDKCSQLPPHAAGQLVAALATDDDERASLRQGLAQRPQRVAAADIDEEVVADRSVEVVARGIVDDRVRSGRSHQLCLGARGHSGDGRAERLGQLDRVAAHTSRGADDEHVLAGFDMPELGQGLERHDPGDGRDRCLVEGQILTSPSRHQVCPSRQGQGGFDASPQRIVRGLRSPRGARSRHR